MNQYSIISTMDESEKEGIIKLKRFLPKKIYLYYLKKHGKVIYKENLYYGEKGDIMMLPFTKEEFDQLEEEYKVSYIEKIIKENQIQNLYMPVHLQKYIKKEDKKILKEYHTILMYMMLPQILELTLYKNGIDRKDLRLTIIDSGDYKVDYVLNRLINDLNHLKIFTDRPEYFSEFVDTIYDDTGLMIDLVSSLSEIENDHCIIIDLSKSHFRYSSNIVIDMESNLLKRQYQSAKNKNATIIYDINLRSLNQRIDNELLGFYLLKNHSYMEDFLNGGNNETTTIHLQRIVKKLELKVYELIYLTTSCNTSTTKVDHS